VVVLDEVVLDEVRGHVVQVRLGGEHGVLARQLPVQLCLLLLAQFAIRTRGIDPFRDPLVQPGVHDVQLLAAVLVVQRQGRAIRHRPLEIVDRHIAAEDLLGNAALRAIDQGRAGEADEAGAGQRHTHVQRQASVLRAMRLVGNDDDVAALVPRCRHLPAKLVDQTEDVAPVLVAQQAFEPLGAGRLVTFVGRHAAADEGAVQLLVERYSCSSSSRRSVSSTKV